MINELFTPKTQKAIENLAARTGKPIDYYWRKARKAILEMIEDELDYLDAIEISQNDEPLVDWEDVKKNLDLEDKIQKIC